MNSPNGAGEGHYGALGALHMQPRDNPWSQILPSHHGPPWQQSQQIPSAPSSVPSQHYQNHPFDLSSIVPQQIMQDFMRLSTPVGTSPNDDSTLAQALYESRQFGKTYRQALEGLHGVNNHAANLWKDYYLDHHDRIDLLVSRLGEQPKTVKKPVVLTKSSSHVKEEGTSPQVARKRRASPPPRPPSPSPPRQSPKKKPRPQASRRKRATPQSVSTVTSVLARPPKRPRATLNSLSAPLPSNDVPNLMPPQVHIPIPEPPSRSPTPPASVQAGTNGNKYTKEDREYFLKFLAWRLRQDPSLTKKELCELLHEKAPHHSVTSWSSHWHQRHDIADKIFATYRESSEVDAEDYEDQQNEEDSEEEVEEEMKNDDDDDDNDDNDARSESVSANEISRDQKVMSRSEGALSDFGEADTEEDEADMGEPGNSFTNGDWRTLARFIAKNPWDKVSQKERWQAFTETCGTRRPGKSWAEFYRKNETRILRLAKKYASGSRSGKQSPSRRERASWRI